MPSGWRRWSGSHNRDGNLPSIRTKKMVEGGEICHWEGQCRYVYETAKDIKQVKGELLVTSKNVMFSSPTKSFSFSPAKILDLDESPKHIQVKVTVRQGAGSYMMADPGELAAILTGLVRKHKYLLSENFSSSKTRHIPQNVKTEVWARDGGRCVKCKANDYLEFDHIYRTARGGANTVNNVQLLCRRCNGEKSDRIGPMRTLSHSDEFIDQRALDELKRVEVEERTTSEIMIEKFYG